MAALMLGLETALYMSNRLKVYIDYLQTLPAGRAKENLEAALIDFHTLILRFLAAAIRIYQKGRLARAFDAFWKLEDVRNFESHCDRVARRAEIEANNCDRTSAGSDRANVEKKLEDLQNIRMSLDMLRTRIDWLNIPFAAGATFDSYQDELDARCHPDTRVDLLRHIRDWAQDPQGKRIFWLNGMAGTGKSTMSRTVAQQFADQGQLGASFFFKRGEGDRGNASKFFTTIARQLMVQVPPLLSSVRKAIDADPLVFERSLKDQFEKLIYQPLSDLSTYPFKLVLVIDALDECEREGDVKTILHHLSRPLNSAGIRVFITSRPELPIRLGFKKMSSDAHRDVALHDIPEEMIRHDISTFLKDEFRKIKDDNYTTEDSLSTDWPGEQQIQYITRIATPLFIVAATICRFVGDSSWATPQEQLAAVLEYKSMSQLEMTYMPVLNQLLVPLPDSEKSKLQESFRKIVGSIVTLADPLSTFGLAKLLDVPKEKIDHILHRLHSVLRIPQDQHSPVRLLHLSFAEFLKSERCRLTPFAVDEIATHRMLAERCLKLLSGPEGLRENICHLEPGQLRSEVDSKTIHLPEQVQYACRYWVHHLEKSKTQVHDQDKVHSFLREHLLHWLEALSLMGNARHSIDMISQLEDLAVSKQFHCAASINAKRLGQSRLSEVYSLIHDAKRFILRHMSVIESAPLQIYSSAILFSPKVSIIRNLFLRNITWVRISAGLEENWDSTLQTLEGHSAWVTSVAFSPDGSKLASGSRDQTVRVWDVASGQAEQTLEGHSDWVTSVAFSPDGSKLASGSDDRTVRVWDVASGQVEQTLESHAGSLTALFPDSGSLQLETATDGVESFRSYGVDGTRNWVTRDGSKILYIPFAHRPGPVAAAGSTLALGGDRNGRVTILIF